MYYQQSEQAGTTDKFRGPVFTFDENQHSQPDGASSQPKVTVAQGDIATFKADVLVNTIAVETTILKYAGAVSRSFFNAGGETLQKEYEKVGIPINFGTDVRVTGTAGAIRAKKILHASIEPMIDAKSIEDLTAMIKTCLEKAEAEKLTSIAFPTLGCGDLRYNQADVSRCFSEAAKGSLLQIYIVANTRDLYEKFRNDFMVQETADLGKSTAGKRHINPLQIVKEKDKWSIHHPAVTQLINKIAEKFRILGLQTTVGLSVQTATDVTEPTITLKGSKDGMLEVTQHILLVVAVDELPQSYLSYIKKHRKEKAYLIALSSMAPRLPEYWDISKSVSDARLPLVKSSPVYNAVELLIKDSWCTTKESTINDVKGNAVSGINVANIWIVVNQALFTSYQFKLKHFALRAAEKPFKAITDLGETEIITKTVEGTDCISEQLVSEVNEVFLCHGTIHVKEIEKNGIDSRFCGDFGVYGRGAYFAESSTKANDYAGPISNQDTKELKRRYMFVARVLLGEPYLCQTNNVELRRAPCNSGCRDRCTAGHPMCDSVVGTKHSFREFIVYNPDQSYPEFLVEYELQ